MDVVSDSRANERRMKHLTVVDYFSLQCATSLPPSASRCSTSPDFLSLPLSFKVVAKQIRGIPYKREGRSSEDDFDGPQIHGLIFKK